MTEYVNVKLPKATAERIDLHQQLSTRELSDMREACRQALQAPVEDGAAEAFAAMFDGTMQELDDLCNFWRQRPERSASRCVDDVEALVEALKAPAATSLPPESVRLEGEMTSDFDDGTNACVVLLDGHPIQDRILEVCGNDGRHAITITPLQGGEDA